MKVYRGLLFVLYLAVRVDCSHKLVKDKETKAVLGYIDQYPIEIENQIHNIQGDFKEYFEAWNSEQTKSKFSITGEELGFIQASLLREVNSSNSSKSNNETEVLEKEKSQVVSPCKLSTENWTPRTISSSNLNTATSGIVDFIIVHNKIYILYNDWSIFVVNGIFELPNQSIGYLVSTRNIAKTESNKLFANVKNSIREAGGSDDFTYIKIVNGYYTWESNPASSQDNDSNKLKEKVYIVTDTGMFEIEGDKPEKIKGLVTGFDFDGLIRAEMLGQRLYFLKEKELIIAEFVTSVILSKKVTIKVEKLYNHTVTNADEKFVDFIASAHSIRTMNSTTNLYCVVTESHCTSIINSNSSKGTTSQSDQSNFLSALFILSDRGVYMYYLKELEKSSPSPYVSTYSFLIPGGNQIERYGRNLYVSLNEEVDQFSGAVGQVFEILLPDDQSFSDLTYPDKDQVFDVSRIIINSGSITNLVVDKQFIYIFSSGHIKIHQANIPREIDFTATSFSVSWATATGSIVPTYLYGSQYLVYLEPSTFSLMSKPTTTPSLLCSRSAEYEGSYLYQLNVTLRNCQSVNNTFVTLPEGKRLCRYVYSLNVTYEKFSFVKKYVDDHLKGMFIFTVLFFCFSCLCICSSIIYCCKLRKKARENLNNNKDRYERSNSQTEPDEEGINNDRKKEQEGRFGGLKDGDKNKSKILRDPFDDNKPEMELRERVSGDKDKDKNKSDEEPNPNLDNTLEM